MCETVTTRRNDMARSPQLKVFRNGEYVAACKHADEAAILVCVLGPGADVRLGHAKRDVLVTGDEIDRDSYDATADLIHARRLTLVGAS